MSHTVLVTIIIKKCLLIFVNFALHQDVDKEKSYDLTIDTADYVTANNKQLLQNLFDYPQ